MQTIAQEASRESEQQVCQDIIRTKYWSMYERMLFDRYYFWHYRQSAIRRSRFVKALLIMFSLANVAGLKFWQSLPDIWPVIAAIAQVMSAILYLFPHSSQISAINMFQPALEELLLRVDRDWDLIHKMTDGEINTLVYEYEKEYQIIHNRFIGATEFPRRKSCIKKADKECNEYKFQRFNIRTFESFKDVGKQRWLDRCINLFRKEVKK